MPNSGTHRRKKSDTDPRRRLWRGRSRRRIVLIGAGVLAINAGIGVAAYAKQSPSDAGSAKPCTLRPNPQVPDESEERSCFSVAASVDRVPAVGETATVRFTVTAEHAAKGVRVEADLPAGLVWTAPPAGLAGRTEADPAPVNGGKRNRADGTIAAFKAGQTRTFEGRISATAAGPAEVRIRALKERPDGVIAAEHALFLTVGAPGQDSRQGIAPPAEGDTVETADATETGKATPFRAPEEVAAPQAAPTSDDPQPRSVAPAAAAAAAAPTACVTGAWVYVDNKGATRPVVNAAVQAWDWDETNAHDLLTTGVTNSKGEYKLCFANADGNGSGQDVYVKMSTSNSRWKVQKTGTSDAFVFKTKQVNNVANGSTSSLGKAKPTDATLMRALQAFDAANDVWLWVPGTTCWDARDAECRQLVINWAPGSTEGNFYRGSVDQIFLQATAPDSRMTVVHEITHALMDDVYEDQLPPIPNCSPHSITKKSSTGCAWVEGFAEWVPASVYNDPYYRWPSGSSLNLETPNASTANWDDGDTVEGRVAGALIDIADSTNEGNDIYGEGDPGNLWQTFIKHRATTFREFWAHRKADGYNTAWTGALKSVYQNSIDYR